MGCRLVTAHAPLRGVVERIGYTAHEYREAVAEEQATAVRPGLGGRDADVDSAGHLRHRQAFQVVQNHDGAVVGRKLWVAFGAILTAAWDAAAIRTIWSSSPWMNRVGTVSFRRSSV